VKVIKDLVKNEGAGAFFKGLTPKVLPCRFYSSVKSQLTRIPRTDSRGRTETGIQLHLSTDIDSFVRPIRLEARSFVLFTLGGFRSRGHKMAISTICYSYNGIQL